MITTQKILLGFVFLVGIVLLLVISLEETSGDTIIVAQDGNGDFHNIRGAINSASDGDNIRVWQGTYKENVVVRKSLNLIGNGSDYTVIDGGRNGAVIRIEEDWVNISGFSILNSGDSIWTYPAGIEVSSSNNHIYQNNCSDNLRGIFLDNANNCKISNNICSNNSNSILLKYSTNCEINNNKCIENRNAIYLYDSSGCTLINNLCEDNPYGITLSNSYDCSVIDNTCIESYYGIYLTTTRDCTFQKNKMYGNGIYIDGTIDDWISHEMDTTNTINGRAIYYYINESEFIVPSGAGQIILVNCSFAEVKNQICTNGSIGIVVGYSSHIKLINNNCSYNYWYGILLYDSHFCIISNNSIIENKCGFNGGSGISLKFSSECHILNNTCTGNSGSSIGLGDFSNNCTIINNICINSWSGMSLGTSDYCYIENNQFINNTYGILLSSNSNCTVTNNIISFSEYNGISLDSSDNCKIENNSCLNNGEFGIELWFNSNSNYLFYNIITKNSVGINLQFNSQKNIAHSNNIFDNIVSGIEVYDNSGYHIDATNNWWGDDSGPFHALNNSIGRGDNVTDYVIFDPWSKEPYGSSLIAIIDSITPNPTNEGQVVIFRGQGIDFSGDAIIRFTWYSSIDGEFYNGTEAEITYNQLSIGTHTIFFNVMNKSGVWSDEDTATLIINPEGSGEPILYPTDFNLNVHGYNFQNWGSGKCYGIASTSILYYENEIPLPNNKEKAFDLTWEEAKGRIYWYHFISKHLKQSIFMSVSPPDHALEYEELKNNIQLDNPMVFMMKHNSEPSGHTVVAYKIEEYENYAKIYLYDSNLYNKITGKNEVRTAIYNFNTEAFFYDHTYDTNDDNIPDTYAMYNQFSAIIPETLKDIYWPDILEEKKNNPEWRGYNNIILACPADAKCITDGYLTIGYDYGFLVNEIPGAFVVEGNDIELYCIPLEYYFDVSIVGNGNGHYNLYVINEEYNETFSAEGIPIKSNEAHLFSFDWDKIVNGSKGISVFIDVDGDRAVDFTVQSDATFTKDDYKKATEEEEEEDGIERIIIAVAGLAAIVVVSLVIIARKKKKKAMIDTMFTPTTPSQQLPKQQSITQPQVPQQYPQAPQGVPTQANGSWFCAKCGSKQRADYLFCDGCGYKRGS